ncbi:hypothetical protein [Bradyrhizobium sp. Leo170]|uniref:hypothetical protein n=1 Tax=Bradyrhizobium sp. Leo170 TaxID=1571199 RepID=UPI00102EA07E|nr:hypothetical protein [Bradyrhizobium sp. Leo170]TAI65694.1 hypothetical protein CWO89_12185 [Bradyrhizobium sp. Leo170]
MSKITRLSNSQIAGTSHVSSTLLGALEDREFAAPLVKECGFLDWMATAQHQSRQHLEEAITTGEALMAEHPWLFEQLQSACAPATIDDARRELAILYMAYPGKEASLSSFMHIVLADVVDARASRFVLAASCRRLRHTLKFRPSIAEVLQAMSPTTDDAALRWLYHAAGQIAAVSGFVATARKRLVVGDYTRSDRNG